jgi:hypothetical protein
VEGVPVVISPCLPEQGGLTLAKPAGDRSDPSLTLDLLIEFLF